ncbi:hypothetical protein LTSEURB_6295, partial [Salmonella enterica subsp. enterica serovar Urbana str. R8-2977]
KTINKYIFYFGNPFIWLYRKAIPCHLIQMASLRYLSL